MTGVVETVHKDGAWMNRLAGERDLGYRFRSREEARLSGVQLALRLRYEYRIVDAGGGDG